MRGFPSLFGVTPSGDVYKMSGGRSLDDLKTFVKDVTVGEKIEKVAPPFVLNTGIAFLDDNYPVLKRDFQVLSFDVCFAAVFVNSNMLLLLLLLLFRCCMRLKKLRWVWCLALARSLACWCALCSVVATNQPATEAKPQRNQRKLIKKRDKTI